MQNPLVTVIMPVYNAETYLKRCVDSILGQTYRTFEIILIDDGSSDGSSALCDAYAVDHNLITVLHQPNSGPATARNAGMTVARGDYFVCVDSDDYVDKDYLFQMVSAAIAYPKAGHIRCGYQTVVNGSVESVVVYSEDVKYSFLPREKYMYFFTKKLAQSPCNCLYRTSVVREHGIQMPTDLSLGEDMLFNLKYMDVEDRTNILVINCPLYNYVFANQNSLVSTYRPDLYQINRRLVLSLKEYMKKWKIYDTESWQLFWNWAYKYYENAIAGIENVTNESTRKIRMNEALQDKNYQEALKNRNTYMNHVIYLAHRSGQYVIVRCAEKLAKFKNSITSSLWSKS